MPPFDYDLADAGKLASDGWAFFTSYNTERATGKLEVTASQKDRDYIAAVNWRAAEEAAAKGLGEVIIAGLLSDNSAFVLQGGLLTGLMAMLLHDALGLLSGSAPSAGA